MLADAKHLHNSEPKARIFISYSREDTAFTDRIEAALKERGFEPLIDRTEIYAFEDWWQRIQALIAQADTVIFVLSPAAVASPVCAREVAFAAALNKRFAPVVFRRIDDKQVPEALSRLNFIFFDDNAQFDDSLNRLCEALSTDIEWIRKHTEYGQAARRWAAAGRAGGLLLRSPALEEAERWIASRPVNAPVPTAETQIFIAASRRRKRHLELALIGILCVVSTAGLIYALWVNYDYLKAQQEIFADALWSKKLTAQVERSYAEMTLRPGQIISFHECTRCPEMIVVPAGQFLMGSAANENGRYDNEGPQHKVVISNNFAVSKFEVTFDEWKACADARQCENTWDQGWGGGRRPVINVNWYQVKQFVDWLSKRAGQPGAYRLLSEAEWEYAARAGTTTLYSWGDDVGKANASCDGCGSQWDYRQSAPVGSFAANPFGLYDMHGNVFEWAEDCYHSNYVGAPADGTPWVTACEQDYRVRRGGSWYTAPRNIRSALRDKSVPGDRDNDLGFRIARTLRR
jgi:formylglycine-generating enzyme required for sulfatase activity